MKSKHPVKTSSQASKKSFLLILLAVFVIISACLIIFTSSSKSKVSATSHVYIIQTSAVGSYPAMLMKNGPGREEFIQKYNLDPDTVGYTAPAGKYVVKTKNILKPGTTFSSYNSDYTNGDESFTIVSRDDSILPYLENDMYCETDSDCTYNTKYCGLAIYNGYSPMALYGCGYPDPDSSLTKEELAKCPKELVEADDTYQSTSAVKYGKITCDNHICTGHDRQVYCAK